MSKSDVGCLNQEIGIETKQKLYLVRRLLGWSQEALGERLGLSQRHYGRLENGDIPLKVDTLEAICHEWGITQQQFYTLSLEQLSELLKSPLGLA